MTINLQKPDITELKPRIVIFGVGGGGGNAINNMISAGLEGVEFVAANTDAQALTASKCDRLIQMGLLATQGLGAGSDPDIGKEAAQECIDEIKDYLSGVHMVFVTAGMGGGTGTGGAPIVAQVAKEAGILTVGVVTKPFAFEGKRRMQIAEAGISELQKHVDTLLVIPNQNLFRVANESTTFTEAFSMADQVLYSGVACITDLMVKKGLINLDFADVRSVMRNMGRAIMGTGEDSGEDRAKKAAEAAISNPLLDETSMKGAQGLLISITGGVDLTLSEVDEATSRIEKEVDSSAIVHFGAMFDESLEGKMRVSVVATGVASAAQNQGDKTIAEQQSRFDSAAEKLRQSAAARNLANEVAKPIVAKPAVKQTPLENNNENNAGNNSETNAESHVVPMAKPQVATLQTSQASQAAQANTQTSVSTMTTDEFSKALNETLENDESDLSSLPSENHHENQSETQQPQESGAVSLLKRLTNGLSANNGDSLVAKKQVVEPQSPLPAANPPIPLKPKIDEAAEAKLQKPAELPESQAPQAPQAPQAVETKAQNPAQSPDIVPLPTEKNEATSKSAVEEEQLDIPAFLRRQVR